MRTIKTLVLTAAVSAFAASAQAEEPLSITIPVSSADLQSTEAVAGLYGRVEAAAEELCDAPNRAAFTTFRSCKREVIAEAVARADIAALSAYADSLTAPAAIVEIASR